MNSRWLLTSTLLLGFTLNPAATRLEYSPTEGAQIEKTFAGEFTVYIEDLAVTMNGEASPFGMDQLDPSDREGAFTYSLEVVDAINGVADGRASEIVRTYSVVEGSAEGGGESEESALDDLVGQSVKFEWDEEGEVYTRSLVDEDAEMEEDMLAALDAEIDMSGLLPEGEVSVGDTWEVAGEMLAPFLVPGIDFVAAANLESDAAAEVPAEILEALENSMEEAIIECKFSGLNGEGDEEMAVISYTMTAEISLDLAEVMAEQMADQDNQMEMEMEEFTIDVSLELQGEMIWSVKRNHFETYEMSGEIALDAYATMSMGGGAMEMEGEAEATSEFTVEGSATVKS